MWSCVQALNMFLVLDKIREEDFWRGHLLDDGRWVPEGCLSLTAYSKMRPRWLT